MRAEHQGTHNRHGCTQQQGAQNGPNATRRLSPNISIAATLPCNHRDPPHACMAACTGPAQQTSPPQCALQPQGRAPTAAALQPACPMRCRRRLAPPNTQRWVAAAAWQAAAAIQKCTGRSRQGWGEEGAVLSMMWGLLQACLHVACCRTHKQATYPCVQLTRMPSPLAIRKR